MVRKIQKNPERSERRRPAAEGRPRDFHFAYQFGAELLLAARVNHIFVELAAVGLKKPKRGQTGSQRPKSLCKDPDPDMLERVAAGLSYESSRYHCVGEKGERPKSRFKPASVCPRRWSKAEATAALRRAVNAGYVSEHTNGDFPRFIWYREGEDTIYEARGEPRTPERFHAYPVESFEVPRELSW